MGGNLFLGRGNERKGEKGEKRHGEGGGGKGGGGGGEEGGGGGAKSFSLRHLHSQCRKEGKTGSHFLPIFIISGSASNSGKSSARKRIFSAVVAVLIVLLLQSLWRWRKARKDREGG